jgi:hypothetical protein
MKSTERKRNCVMRGLVRVLNAMLWLALWAYTIRNSASGLANDELPEFIGELAGITGVPFLLWWGIDSGLRKNTSKLIKAVAICVAVLVATPLVYYAALFISATFYRP